MVRRPQGRWGALEGVRAQMNRVGYGREPWGPAEEVWPGGRVAGRFWGVGAQMNGVGYRGEPWGPAIPLAQLCAIQPMSSHPGPSLVPTFRPREGVRPWG